MKKVDVLHSEPTFRRHFTKEWSKKKIEKNGKFSTKSLWKKENKKKYKNLIKI